MNAGTQPVSDALVFSGLAVFASVVLNQYPEFIEFDSNAPLGYPPTDDEKSESNEYAPPALDHLIEEVIAFKIPLKSVP